MKMSASQCPALELKAGTLYSSVCPHGEAVNHSCLPGFCLHSVYSQPVTEHFYLSHATPFGVSKLCSLLWHHSCHSSWGREGGLALVLLLVRPLL